MRLNFRAHGVPVADRPPVYIVHGLFGSASNWNAIARRIARDHEVVVPDLRNHGASPHANDVGYDALAGDLAELMDHLGHDRVALVGHSMGGKAAMWLALDAPERIERLMVVDIAPVSYAHDFDSEVAAMRAIPLDRIGDRREADTIMAEHIDEAAVRAFLLQNLVRDGDQWRWRINLDALDAGGETATGFPDPGARRYDGRCQFLHGGASNYVQPMAHGVIERLFPAATITTMPGAGHWLHAEKPAEFVAALQDFLSS